MSLNKWIRAASNFITHISSRLNRQVFAIFFLRWILKDCIKVLEKKNKVVVVCSRPRWNVKFGTFTSQSCNEVKEMYKKGNARAKLLFCLHKLIVFCPSRCRRHRRCLSSIDSATISTDGNFLEKSNNYEVRTIGIYAMPRLSILLIMQWSRGEILRLSELRHVKCLSYFSALKGGHH